MPSRMPRSGAAGRFALTGEAALASWGAGESATRAGRSPTGSHGDRWPQRHRDDHERVRSCNLDVQRAALAHLNGEIKPLLSYTAVVDATGRGSRTPVWLEQLGYARPEADRLEIGIGYAPRRYRLRPGALGDDLIIITGPPRPTPEQHSSVSWRVASTSSPWPGSLAT